MIRGVLCKVKQELLVNRREKRTIMCVDKKKKGNPNLIGVGFCFYLLCITYCLLADFSVANSQQNAQEKLVGRWRLAEANVESQGNPADNMASLSSLPYLQGYHKAPLKKGVVKYDPDLSCDGINFYNSGHRAEAGIMDMRGNVLHKWVFDIEDIWPGEKKAERGSFWRRVHLYDNGDILAIYGDIGMVKLDKDSKLLWCFRNERPHHHMQLDGNGNIYVLTRKTTINKRINKNKRLVEDFITILNRDGKVIKNYSLLELFENSRYAKMLVEVKNRGDNYLMVGFRILAHYLRKETF